MTKRRLLSLIGLSLLGSVCISFSYADNCADLYMLDEAKFTARVQQYPVDVYNTLNQCITNQACSTSANQASCMQNMYYYNAMAAYYYQEALSGSSRMMLKTPANIAPAPQAPAPQAAQNAPTENPYSQSVIIAPNNVNNNDSNNDIYKNIRF